jgi:CRP-like cAMP-binding protein
MTAQILSARRNGLGQTLSAAEAFEASGLMRYEVIPAGQVVNFSGRSSVQAVASAPRLMLILEGDVALYGYTNNSDDPVTVMANLGRGATIGKVQFFSEIGPPLLAEAVDDLHVASLSRSAYNEMLQRNPTLAAKLVLCLCAEMSMEYLESVKRNVVMGQLVRSLEKQVYVDRAEFNQHEPTIAGPLR